MDALEPRIRLRRASVSPTRRITLKPDHSTSDELRTPPRRVRPRNIYARNPSKRAKNGPSTSGVPQPPEIQSQSSAGSESFPLSPASFPSFDCHTPDPIHQTVFRSPQSLVLEEPVATETKDSYECFVEAVFGQVCAIYQLSQRLFVVNGWNTSAKTVSVSFLRL